MKVTVSVNGISLTATNAGGLTQTVFIKSEHFDKIKKAIKLQEQQQKFNNEEL